MRSQGWPIALFCLLLAACAKEKPNGPRRWAAFPVPVYADSSLGADSISDIQEAMTFWDSRAGKRLFDFRGTWDHKTSPAFTGSPDSPSSIAVNLIFELNPWQFSASIAAQTAVLYSQSEIRGSLIMLNGELHTCSGNCRASSFGSTSRRRIFAHELGHFLGMGHSGDGGDVMYQQIQAGNSLDDLRFDSGSLASVTN